MNILIDNKSDLLCNKNEVLMWNFLLYIHMCVYVCMCVYIVSLTTS